LDLYYSSFYESNDTKITFDDPKRFGRHLFDQTRKYLTNGKKTLSILYYGGGIGTISIELAKRYLDFGIPEVKVLIVDYEQSALIDDIPNLVINNCSALSEVKDQKFDIIIASAIIEHLPTPRTEITCLFELLNEHGLIYFRSPYVMPIILLLKKLKIDSDFTYPGHIHDLGQKFWDNVLDTFDLKNGFNILYSRPSIVETTFSKHFRRTLIAYLCKTPWYVLGNRWRFVGGWEILIQKGIPKTTEDTPERGT
ncbi:MAG: Methyltransferase type 12, partial [Methanomicrobiales archaeon 53_19]